MRNSKQIIDRIVKEKKDEGVFNKILAYIPVECLKQITLEDAEQVTLHQDLNSSLEILL